ncbi:Rha family transcriptional regulator [Sphingobium sp. CFD-1]|uniref:Rha family transcriptional regulator n=1 Tax=Sphingobium sp. CFD-1 TaxID=2878545 RepID=UPI00214C0568|nr:Rha family transcriptional regulator [Sphingobium sp. CFD-1]
MNDTLNVPVFIVKDGAPIADSRNVAKAFGKRHDHLLDKVDGLLRDAPELNGPNFRVVPYEDAKGEIRRAFEMDRDGFVLLAMGFTGKRVLKWKLAYIDAFNRMEAALHNSAPIALPADVRQVIGGIVKGIVHKELTEIVPALVSEQIMSDRRKLIEGVSALEIAEMAGYTKGKRPRGLIQFITARIRRYHEDRGYLPHRTPHGSCKVLVYVEAVARRWLSEGGRASIDAYVAERKGQGRLRLVEVRV